MVLKDWKSEKSKTYILCKSKKGTYGNNKKEVCVGRDINTKEWEVDFFNIPDKEYKKFKTKPQAIRHAMNFMRKH